MKAKTSKLIARLRKQQPALILIPWVIIAQIFASRLPSLGSVVICAYFVFTLIYSRGYLSIIAGLCLGLISSLEYTKSAESFHSNQFIVAKVHSDSLRRPKLGQVKFKIRTQARLSNESASSLLDKSFICSAVNLPWRNVSRIKQGDLILIKANFSLFSERLWPWEYQASLLRRGIAGDCKVIYLAKLEGGQMSILASLRHQLLTSFRAANWDDELSGLILSLTLGVRDQISLDAERKFKDFGISHVLVLSGMQIGLLFYSMYRILRFISPKILVSTSSAAILNLIITATMVLLLVALTDFEASAMRAWIASVLMAISSINERKTNLFRGTFASLLVLVLIWPGCWAEAGVQLSFVALIGIALGSNIAENRISAYVLPCLFASLFSSFLAAVWFLEFSLASIISNFMLAPILGTFGCYMGLLALFFSLLDFKLAHEILFILRYCFDTIFEFCLFLHKATPAMLTLEPSMAYTFLIILISILLEISRRSTLVWIKEYNLFSVRSEFKVRKPQSSQRYGGI
jgi:ComEC/Rec2-related protein